MAGSVRTNATVSISKKPALSAREVVPRVALEVIQERTVTQNATRAPTGNCARNCSSNCAGEDNSCHHINGSCDKGCKPGYVGSRCSDKCTSGTYGPACDRNCNSNCAGVDNSCHHVNGICDKGCEPGYLGAFCSDECTSGTYGRDCARNCSSNCAGVDNSTCHHVNGSCDKGCRPGYMGSFCSDEIDLRESATTRKEGKDQTLLIVIGTFASLLAIALGLAILFWGRSRRSNTNSASDAYYDNTATTSMAGIQQRPSQVTGPDDAPSDLAPAEYLLVLDDYEEMPGAATHKESITDADYHMPSDTYLNI